MRCSVCQAKNKADLSKSYDVIRDLDKMPYYPEKIDKSEYMRLIKSAVSSETKEYEENGWVYTVSTLEHD